MSSISTLLTLCVALQGSPECKDDKCAVPLLKGTPAPFSGQLLSTQLAISLGQKAEYGDKLLELETEKLKAEFTAELRLAEKLMDLQEESKDRQIAYLRKELDKATYTPFYERPMFVAIVSVLATTALFIGAVKTIESLE